MNTFSPSAYQRRRANCSLIDPTTTISLVVAITLGLLTNQVATGLALALFGTGLSAFLGQPLQGATLPARAFI